MVVQTKRKIMEKEKEKKKEKNIHVLLALDPHNFITNYLVKVPEKAILVVRHSTNK